MSRIDEMRKRTADRIDEMRAQLKSRMDALASRTADCEAALSAKLGGAEAAVAAEPRGEALPARSVWDGNGPMRKLALCAGLNRVDEFAYQGRNIKPLSGCIVDAQRFKCVLDRLGFGVSLLADNQATCAAVFRRLREAAGVLEPGDLFVFHISGHGGREEVAGKMQESWYLYDGCVWGKEIVWAFSQFKRGVRILVINDQCHSGGIFQPKFTRTAPDVVLRCGRDAPPAGWDAAAAADSSDFPMLIQFAGCRAEQCSIDGLGGGSWTQSLVNALDEAAACGVMYTYRSWFNKAFCSPTLHRGSQDPQWVEMGPVSPAFRNMPALM